MKSNFNKTKRFAPKNNKKRNLGNGPSSRSLEPAKKKPIAVQGIKKAQEIIDPKGSITKLEHDWRGKVIYQVDPKGVKTRMKYDPRGNLADMSVFNRDETISSKMSFVYGALGFLSERTEVVGLATVLSRNTFKGSDPAKDVIVKTLYTYDLVGNLLEKAVTRPATGEVAKTNYVYNGINKLTSVSSSGYKHNINKALSYDDNSNLTELVQNNLKLSFQYDKINRAIIAETFADPSGVVKVPAFALNYSYTPGGQIKSIKDASNVELVGFEHDQLFNPNLVRSGKFSIGMEFDALGRKKKITYPNKLETTFAFDGVDRLSDINTPGVGNRSFDYDEVSNINQVKSESGQFDYAYDQNSALIGAYYKGGEGLKDEKFVWDASGNKMNGTRDPSSNAIRPRPILINNGLFEDAEPMTTSGVGRYSFIYDMHGNVVKKFDNEANVYYVLEYDADNKLVYAEKYVNDSLNLKAKYFYDGLGRRVEKEVTKGSTVTRKSYVYNGENILLEYNTAGATPVEAAKYIGTGAIDDNLMTIRIGKGYFYHKDQLGSINAISNDAGEVVQKNQYSSFGKIVSIKDKDRRDLGVAKALDQPFYYTGREWDEELSLYYYRARSYDPVQGRFMQKDPIGLAGGDTNLYRYVGNNPISFIDPTGLCAVAENEMGRSLDYIKHKRDEFRKNNPNYADKILLLTTAQLTFGAGLAVLATPVAVAAAPILYNVASDPNASGKVLDILDNISGTMGGPTTGNAGTTPTTLEGSFISVGGYLFNK